MARQKKEPDTPIVLRGPQPGDHFIRLTEPVGVRCGKWRGSPKEWTVSFRMEDGHVLYVSLKSEADLLRLRDFVGLAVERAGFAASPEGSVSSESLLDDWCPEDDMS